MSRAVQRCTCNLKFVAFMRHILVRELFTNNNLFFIYLSTKVPSYEGTVGLHVQYSAFVHFVVYGTVRYTCTVSSC
jgi:hypothetical protein